MTATGPDATSRGHLRVYLGAAPGVGKTFKMLEEGRRRMERGADVVVAVVETHGRPRTQALLDGLEVVPRRTVEYRGALLDDLDLDAVLSRRPAVALVDEMAHTNAPGSRHAKRWQDIEELLTAGIDVVTTVNVQHLESLNDALTRITGVEQREVVPDDVVRRADQIELVDMAPEALRRRIVHGNVYPPERVEAALANYFRVGNLTALRELALLWVADRVDDELVRFRDRHGIDTPWETRERIVVAITGAPSGEHLVRRAARLAERSRAELVGVHVRRGDGLGGGDDQVARHRRLLADLGGRYHEVVGDDTAASLVAFARAENATQLVLGTTRRSRLDEMLHGSVINRAVRNSPDIDVHVVALDEPQSIEARPTRPPRETSRARRRTAVEPRRRALAWVVAIVGPMLLAAAFVPFRGEGGLPGALPAFVLIVVAAALLGGTPPALTAAVVGSGAGNVALTQPYGTLRVTEASSVVALVSFLVVGAVVAVLVGRLASRTAEVARSQARAHAIASSAASLAASDEAVPMLLDTLRSVLSLTSVSIERAGVRIAAVGSTDGEDQLVERIERVDLPDGHALVWSPPISDAEDRLVVRAFADQLAAALRRSELVSAQHRAETLDEIDRFRTALLRAVSHDLRTPLSAIMAAGSSLQQDDVEWPDDARREFVDTIVEEGGRLDRIITNLLDASRLEAGVLAVRVTDVDLDDVVERAVRDAPAEINVVVSRSTVGSVTARADRVLLDRVLENLVLNAARYAPGPVEIEVDSSGPGSEVTIRVVDHGPGVPAEMIDVMFRGFQRLDDRGGGVGLGLAVARGFVEAMGGVLAATPTPGGGLTMEVRLPGEPADV